MPESETSTHCAFWAQASIHCWKLPTLKEVKSPPEWSIPHSTVKLSPLDVTMVLLLFGHETPVAEEPAATDVEEAVPLVVVVPLGATQVVFL